MRSRRRRQQVAHARLVVRTPHGDASFEVPDFGGTSYATESSR